MLRALVILASLLVLASCARASTQSLQCLEPEPGAAEPFAASCSDGVLVCRNESGSRCLPAAVSCYASSGDYVCERIPGTPDGTLDAVCIVGDFDRDQLLRTTPRCGELRSDGGR